MSPAMQNAPAHKAPLSEYVGAWIGTFQGHTWFTIRLMHRGDQLTGMLQRPRDVQFDDQGEVKSVSDEKWAGRIESAKPNGDGLLLTVKDPATHKTDRYLMRLTNDTTAEVKMVATSMPTGTPNPKPWHLTRVAANAITPVR
jgi:hypothetical protein